MGFVKCPRCELNYMPEGDRYCQVCMREMKGEEKSDPFELCSICNENPALPGKDACLFCLKEMGKTDKASKTVSDEEVEAAPLEMDSVSTMDEIDLDTDEEDIPERELGEIDREFSLEEEAEAEEAEAERDEMDELEY